MEVIIEQLTARVLGREYSFLAEDVAASEGTIREAVRAVSYTHLRAHETSLHLVCRLLLEKKK